MCFVSAEQLSGSRPWGAQRGPVRAPGGDGASVWREQAVWNRRLSLDNTRSAVAIGRSIAFLVLGLAALSVARCDSPPLPPRPCSGLTARPLLRAPSRPHRSYPTHNPFPCPLASPWPPVPFLGYNPSSTPQSLSQPRDCTLAVLGEHP